MDLACEPRRCIFSGNPAAKSLVSRQFGVLVEQRPMHEVALSQSIVDLVVECARQEGVHTVTRVVVEVGIAAGVEPDALRFCFDLVAVDTVVQGSELAIETIALQARCRNCGCEFEPAGLVSSCPRCGSYAPYLLRGRELRVKSFDAE